jgi:hypothetical protein
MTQICQKIEKLINNYRTNHRSRFDDCDSPHVLPEEHTANNENLLAKEAAGFKRLAPDRTPKGALRGGWRDAISKTGSDLIEFLVYSSA